MIIEGIAVGFLANFGYDSVKKIPQTLQDTYSNVYDDSIKELVPIYPKLTEIHIDQFLHEPSVHNLIKAYFEYPEKQTFYENLSKEFTNFFEEGYFSIEEAKKIVFNFLEILDRNIRKNPKLEENLILSIVKDTNSNMQDISRILKEYTEKNQIHLKSFNSTNEFFIRYLENTNLLNHTYPFIGRNEILSQLNKFIESDKKIALLSGRGGIGKSRILLEFGRDFESRHDEWELRYLF